MAQNLVTDYPIDPTATSGTDLADILNRTHQSLQSGQSGLTRPLDMAAGGIWSQQTAGGGLNLMLFDGVKDNVVASISVPGGSINIGATLRTEFALATADQTVFPILYNPNFVIVIRNGATLLPTRDYTATDGTTLTLLKACDLDDEIAIMTT